MNDSQETDLVRKSPRQKRARETVATIIEATARILAEEGSGKLTTNHIARKAGFSIGTLYQYFPNREAIVLALIERQRDEVGRRIAAVLGEPFEGTPEARIGRIVHVVHDAFTMHRMPERRFLQALIRLAIAQGLPSPPNTIAHILFGVWSGSGARLSESEAFVLTHALFEPLRQAALQASPLLGTPAFQRTMVRLVVGFLRTIGTD